MLRMGLLTAVSATTSVCATALVGASVGLTESPLPSVSPVSYAAIIAVTALLGLLSIDIPPRASMRARPVDAIGIGE